MLLQQGIIRYSNSFAMCVCVCVCVCVMWVEKLFEAVDTHECTSLGTRATNSVLMCFEVSKDKLAPSDKHSLSFREQVTRDAGAPPVLTC